MAERGQTNNEFDDEEAAFLRQVEKTKDTTVQQCEDVKKLIIGKRPSPNASQSEKDDYRELLRYADQGMGKLRNWIENMFSKLIDIIKQIVTWIWNQIVDIGKKIANAFKSVIDLFF
ncbi:unnamed protein product [Rotaria sp. Silwood2]|nr:unnamed protein product [Rotaria sp. Silwood2]CAF2982499.1 unnamed protein product [Rotaria sp. Silwood2]CAF3187030.1 unnamed protein product [Rotaria sp. Silwood2]CAF4549826.1 unnamed protein product [Rotaria sp. Silwood2]CAF4560125.1 unnamed protein product [Rotaria sp. Silwood2]